MHVLNNKRPKENFKVHQTGHGRASKTPENQHNTVDWIGTEIPVNITSGQAITTKGMQSQNKAPLR
jgi:hypothetical protein